MSQVANPTPTDGVIDRLTDEQTTKLKSFWEVFFRLVDEAPVHGPDGPSADDKDGTEPQHTKDASSRNSSAVHDSNDRDLAPVRVYLKKYGSKRFMETYWRYISVDYPDVMMLKFLRARKWEINASIIMLVECMMWRIESDIEKIVAQSEEGFQDSKGFIKQYEIGKAYLHGTDRGNRPICYIHVRLHRLFDQDAKALENFILHQMECARLMITYPDDKMTMIFDMTGFGLSNMDWKCAYFIVKCLADYYPETLNYILLHNAPWIFQGIWRVLAPVMDPVVRSKVQFTRTAEDLKVHIDETHLIKQLGGTSEWKWTYIPVVPGENSKMQDEPAKKALQAERAALVAEHTRLTRAWMHTAAPHAAQARRVLDDALRAQAFVLETYVRGRSAYDRAGVIAGDGRVVFHYPGLDGAGEAREVLAAAKARGALLKSVRESLRELEAAGADLPHLPPPSEVCIRAAAEVDAFAARVVSMDLEDSETVHTTARSDAGDKATSETAAHR